ncbi:MAG: hypothetical protein M1472_01105 [Planctomycetes bacterium]|nr:hypothetical protein [Planctomycetota bacterium]
MRNRNLPKDPDLLGALPALRRAAREALRLAIATGTPCYVVRDGKIVNIAAKRLVIRQARSQARQLARVSGTPLAAVCDGKGVRTGISKKTSRFVRKKRRGRMRDSR